MALDEGLPRGQRLCDLAVPHHDEPVRRLRAAKQSQPPTQPLVQGEDDEERELPLPDTAPSPEEHLENSELGRELAAALDEVSDEHRRIVLLRDVSGMSYTEIAEILEVSEGTVKSRLSRARIALRKILLKRGNLFHLPSSKDMEGGEEHE